jgi:tetratricopeptide (TPR) repeat protein
VKKILIALTLGLAFFFPVTAQETSRGSAQPSSQQLTPAEQEAETELNSAAQSYRDGQFAEAQWHSEKALALNPASKTALLFVARTIHAQFKPGDRSEANIAKGREAIDAYKRILVQDPHNEEAYKTIAYLYAALKEDDLLSQWVLQRAIDATVSEEKRADAFVVLASRYWVCSFKITESPSNRTAILKDGTAEVHYTKPKYLAEFEKARQCAESGLQMVETAIGLSPENEAAWSYKTNLLLELSRLAEMDNQLDRKSEYLKQSEAAQHRTTELSEKNRNPGCCLEFPKVRSLDLPKSKP